MKARLRKMRPRFFLSGFFLSWQSMQLFHEKNGVTIPNMPPVRAAARGGEKYPGPFLVDIIFVDTISEKHYREI